MCHFICDRLICPKGGEIVEVTNHGKIPSLEDVRCAAQFLQILFLNSSTINSFG